MKKKIFCLIISFLMMINGLSLVGCDIFGNFNDDNDDENEFPKIENSVDLNEYTPTNEEDNIYIEGEKYYTSKAVDLVTEVNGNYSINRPFTLDKENENKRIYHNIYFYEEDFFQIIYYKKVNDLGSIYAILSDESDKEYAQVEYTEKGNPLQINIIKEGVYNLILDIETFGIDMVKVKDIDTPVYETIKSCELYVHISLNNYSYTEMTLNKETGEYYIQKEIPRNASLGFFNSSHMGRYKITIDESINNSIIWKNNTDKDSIRVHVGGNYKIYINAKTYKVRVELLNADNAKYYCQVGWQQNKELSAVSTNTPYLFEYEFEAQGKIEDPYVEIPDFYPELGMPYNLQVIDEDGFVAYDIYLKESGRYKLTVNLKEFTLKVEKID